MYDCVWRSEEHRFSDSEAEFLARAEAQYEVALKEGGTVELADGTLANRGNRFRRTSIRAEDGRILFALVLALEPEHVIELGTSLGASALFIAAAVNRLGKGELHTIELNGQAQAIARAHVEEAGFSRVMFHHGTFQEVLPPLLGRLDGVRMAFIDGHHKERPTWNYFRQFLKKAVRPAILVFDDIGWSDEMRQVWRRIADHPAVAFSMATEKLGIALLAPDESSVDSSAQS